MVKIAVIAGVTASGKSRLAVELAKRFNGEIISADAFQVYKGMDIGTNKTTIEKMDGIPHHLIDCVEVNEEWDVSIFQKKARILVDEIVSRGRLPIVCGGTGFYIQALIKDYVFLPLKQRNDYSKETNERLWNMLLELDEKEAARVRMNNRRRVEKALDFVKGHAIKKSEHDQRSNAFVYDALIIFLDPPKDEVGPLIRSRTSAMLQHGWEQEVKNLQAGFPSFANSIAAKAIGYEQIMTGNFDMDLISEKIIEYGRKQRTWFVNKHPERTLLIKDSFSPQTLVRSIEAVRNFLDQRSKVAHAA